MSSSPASRRGRAWTLRARLVAAVVALLAVVCLGIGVATTLAFRGQLDDQLNAQLIAVADRPGPGSDQRPGQGPPGDEPGGPGGRRPTGNPFLGQPDGTLNAQSRDGALAFATTLDVDTESVTPVATVLVILAAADLILAASVASFAWLLDRKDR